MNQTPAGFRMPTSPAGLRRLKRYVADNLKTAGAMFGDDTVAAILAEPDIPDNSAAIAEQFREKSAAAGRDLSNPGRLS